MHLPNNINDIILKRPNRMVLVLSFSSPNSTYMKIYFRDKTFSSIIIKIAAVSSRIYDYPFFFSFRGVIYYPGDSGEGNCYSHIHLAYCFMVTKKFLTVKSIVFILMLSGFSCKLSFY